MATTLDNLIDQALDIAGTLFQTDALIIGDESQQLGRAYVGQTGSAVSIAGTAPTMTLTGLTGMTAQSINNFITLEGVASPGNNGTFLITAYNSATSVDILNASGVGGDANNGSISWTERRPWSAEDDHNYHRTDRAAIKGVPYDADIPTYYQCTDQVTPVFANLLNIAGKTTDAKAFVVDRKYENAQVEDGYTSITLTAVGQLKHADGIDITGVPINDGYDAGNDEATYAEIIADGYQQGLLVLSGPNTGYRIFGRMIAGASTSPNSVEVELRAVSIDDPIGTSVPYTWEAEQPEVVDIYYPYRSCLDGMSETAFRTTMVNGLISDAGLSQDVNNIYDVIGADPGDTDLNGLLTNTGMYYPFYNLPDATPSVVEALNTLNEQIGDRVFAGDIIGDNDGYTITDILQNLADAISSSANSSIVRTIERVSATINAGTAHTLPGGLSYVLDGTDNGQNMWVFWRGQLQDPGDVADGNDYEETSTTSITPYVKIKNKDHINYFIDASA
jgi:hypothetical protein